MPRHIVTCVVRNSPLVFTRVAGLCAQRRYAVESIIGRPGETPGISLVTLVIEADQARIENAVRNLDKLIDVLRVDVLSPASAAACEVLLAEVNSAVTAASGPAWPPPAQGLSKITQ
jgi:acetolactate synthase I/III small subunit